MWDKPKKTQSKIKRGSEFLKYMASLSRNHGHKNKIIGKLARALSIHIEQDLQGLISYYEEQLKVLNKELDDYRSSMPIQPPESTPSFGKKRRIPSNHFSPMSYQFFTAFALYDRGSRVLEQLRQLGAFTYEQHKKRQFSLAKVIRSCIEQNSSSIASFHRKRKEIEAQ
jgi:hypothetical protein